MLLLQGSSERAKAVYAVLFLCLCIVMQVLGSTMTLWTLDLAFDMSSTPTTLEGYSLPTFYSGTEPSATLGPSTVLTERMQCVLSPPRLFRPPNPFA